MKLIVYNQLFRPRGQIGSQMTIITFLLKATKNRTFSCLVTRIFCECRLVLAISMDAEVETLKRELAELVEDGILSKIHVDIFNDKFTMTYEQILKKV